MLYFNRCTKRQNDTKQFNDDKPSHSQNVSTTALENSLYIQLQNDENRFQTNQNNRPLPEMSTCLCTFVDNVSRGDEKSSTKPTLTETETACSDNCGFYEIVAGGDADTEDKLSRNVVNNTIEKLQNVDVMTQGVKHHHSDVSSHFVIPSISGTNLYLR